MLLIVDDVIRKELLRRIGRGEDGYLGMDRLSASLHYFDEGGVEKNLLRVKMKDRDGNEIVEVIDIPFGSLLIEVTKFGDMHLQSLADKYRERVLN